MTGVEGAGTGSTGSMLVEGALDGGSLRGGGSDFVVGGGAATTGGSALLFCAAEGAAKRINGAAVAARSFKFIRHSLVTRRQRIGRAERSA